MRVGLRATAVVFVAAAVLGAAAPAASALPASWETSNVRHPVHAQGYQTSSGHPSGTVTTMCSGGCYQ
ncbi:hypothetical protein ABZT28_45500 [Streptomyces sp. NPDC005388]|uniref:hypothetical protein n=1 Tax=Streptomyces sp. NPDC005388 TaxID=3156717 RepID=UPI0033ACEE49